MEVQVYVRNLARRTAPDELARLFARAGEVTAVDLITDPHSGESLGYAYVTMSAQSEADSAVSMFSSYLLDDHVLYVTLAQPRCQRGFDSAS
jgi:RNA recognition motif-containing protein